MKKRVVIGISRAILIPILVLSSMLIPSTIVSAATLSLSPTSGAPGTGVTVTGDSFTPSTGGWIWFDSDSDSVRDTGEPQLSVSTTGAGTIPSGTTFAVPSVAPGSYSVRADIPSGAPIEASSTFVVLPTPSISISPTSGAQGTGITVTGGAFIPSVAGWIWFDSNRDGIRDTGEPQTAVTTTAAGALPSGITLSVPAVASGIWQVRADIPAGGSVEAAATFTVPPSPSISISPTLGASGTITTISGSGFVPNTSGWVWFDINGDSVLDANEPQLAVTTTGTGAILSGTTMAIPSVLPGTFLVRADIDGGGAIEASTTFTVLPPSISVSPTSGVSGTVATVTGSGFVPNTPGWVWFDSNSNSIKDTGEAQVLVTTTSTGAIPGGITLAMQGGAPGAYMVRADIAAGGAVEASTTFTISPPSVSISPASGTSGVLITITGSGFTPNTAGWVWFDSNSDNIKDTGEPQIALTATSTGTIPIEITLTIPAVATSTYWLRADIPGGGSTEASTIFTVPALSMSLSPTSGVVGTLTTISGNGYTLNTAGWIWFDNNSDNVRDPGEPQMTVTTTSIGTIPSGITLSIPGVMPGTYLVRADIPGGGVVEALAIFTVPSTSISLSPSSGAAGTVMTITGSGFTSNTAGWVWFDSNRDSARDPNEPQILITTTVAGAIPPAMTLIVTTVAPGGYRVLADIPGGGIIEDSASFIVPTVSISLSPSSGAAGTVMTITGSGFTPNTAGWVWFDNNSDNIRDPGEPQVPLTTNTVGALPSGTILAVLSVAPGTYRVLADLPIGAAIEASANFVVPSASISLSPTSGAAGTVISITGSGFTSNTAGWLWFDSNADTLRDAGEPQVSVNTTAAGAISDGSTLTVPIIGPGTYAIRADMPTDGSVEASASFTVPPLSLSLSSTSGAPGTVITIIGGGFTPNTGGWVWFDSNADTLRDAVEPQVSVTTTATGAISSGITLLIQNVAAGSYQVRADIPFGGSVEASASFNVLAVSLTLSPTLGASGTVTTVAGTGFTSSTAGWVWLDVNADTIRDIYEPQVAVTTTGTGAIPSGTILTVPSVVAGGYQVRADIPSGGSVEASANFSVLAVSLALSPASGVPATVITITGNGFVINSTGIVWFDSNSDSVKDVNEPQVSVTSTSAGFIPAGVTLTVPDVPDGSYKIRADVPNGGSIEASTSFGVAASPSTGLLLGSARGEIILAPGVPVEVMVPSTTAFMGTIGIQSTGLRYDIDVWTTISWNTVVEAGTRNASYPVSGFGLRINNDTTESMTVSYVVVYLR